MAFPFNSNNNLLSEQAILAGAADVSAGQGVFRVSAITAGGNLTLNGDASNNRVSTLQNDAANLHVSAFLDNGSVSAKSSDAGLFRVSSILDSGSVSAKNSDAGNLRISAIIDNGSVSAKSADGNQFHVSALSPDAGLFRVSGILDSGSVSAKSSDANNFHVSSFNDSGSISAKSGDANQLHSSAVQGDAGLLRVSSFDSAVTTNTGGLSVFSTSAGIAQLSAIKQSAGRLYGWYIGNPAGSDQYLRIYDASATSAVTGGTTVPNVLLYVPTLGGANSFSEQGIAMVNGIVCDVVSAVNGTTAGASALRVNLFYA